ncbi:MAG: hypothetical protein ACR2P0_00345 [Acidimicrobiales bacterium]
MRPALTARTLVMTLALGIALGALLVIVVSGAQAVMLLVDADALTSYQVGDPS